ncbi:MAG: hypothetical protein WBM68_04465 [Woeseia sp.]
MKKTLVLLVIWMVASAVAAAFAMLSIDSISVDGSYVFANNDAFYHARRILDAAIGERGFYQFDDTIHVPEGSWIAWPWGYDYLVACALQIALWFKPTLDPMQFLAYITVAWLPVNVALLLAITGTLQLRLEFRGLVAAGFALLPLTQSLHQVGALDHHFIELTFVLLTCWLSLRFFTDPLNRWAAACCGISFGLALAFHHALFILQLPLLISLFILWLRGSAPAKQSLLILAGLLLATTLLVALPSEPLRDGQFLMSTLSWFHVYISLCVASLLAFMALVACSQRALLVITGMSVLMAIPVLSEFVLGGQFLAGQLAMLGDILEMTSPLRMMAGDWGVANTLGVYSALLLLVPVLIAIFIYRAFTQKESLHAGMAVFSAFGLVLLLFQYRLNYFGLPFLLIGPAYLLHTSTWVGSQKRLYVAFASMLVFAVMFQPPLRGPLFVTYPLGGDHIYAQTYSLLKPLREHCKQKPGVVAAASQFGHYIRFHSDCSVIANNFLLTPLHFAKVAEVNSLFHMTPQELRAARPDVRYVLAFLSDAYEMRDGQVRFKAFDDIAERNPALILGLFFAETPATGFNGIGEVSVDTGAGQKVVLARLYEIVRDDDLPVTR